MQLQRAFVENVQPRVEKEVELCKCSMLEIKHFGMYVESRGWIVILKQLLMLIEFFLGFKLY